MAASQVLSIFIHEANLIIACKNRIYVPNAPIQEIQDNRQNEDDIINLSDTEDLFETSVDDSFQDIILVSDKSNSNTIKTRTPQLSIAYKYKHQALAYCVQGDYLYSLHIKKSLVDCNKTNSSNCDTFFIECCNLTNFSCVSACISTFETNSNDTSDHFWIDTISLKLIKEDFIENNFSSKLQLYQNLDKSIVLFVSCLKKNVRALALIQDEIGKDVIAIESVNLTNKVKHPIHLRKNINKSSLHETSVENNDILKDIENLLSTQLADTTYESLTFDASNIKQVLTQDLVGKYSIIILYGDGNMFRYEKIGKELRKSRLYMKSIVTCASDTNHGIYALSQSGILYKVSDINPHFDLSGANKDSESSDIVKEVLEISELVEEVNIEKIKQQNIMMQLKIFSQIEKSTSFVKKLTCSINKETFRSASFQLHNRLNFKITLSDYSNFISEFWKILVTVETSRDIERSFQQHIIAFPVEYKCGSTLVTDIDIPEDLTLNCLPLSVSIQLLLHVRTKICLKQFRTHLIYFKKFTTLDFVSAVSSVFPDTKDSSNIQSNNFLKNHLPANEETIDQPSNDFDSFLIQMNRSRPVHAILHDDRVSSIKIENELQNVPLFSIKINSQRLECLSIKNNFFAELKHLLKRNCDRQFEAEVLKIVLFQETFSVKISIQNSQEEKVINLEFSGAANGIGFSKFKYDLLCCLREDIEIQPKELNNVSVSFELKKKLEVFKRQLEVLDVKESPEANAKYRKILINWRKTLNNVIFSLYKLQL